MLKACRKCSEPKPLAEFRARPITRSRDGHDGTCRACHATDQVARYHRDLPRGRSINSASAARRADKKRAEDRAYGAAHKTEKQAYDRTYRVANVDKITQRVGAWKAANRPRVNAAATLKRHTDPATRLAHNISVQMRNALRGRKPAAWRELVGYSPDDLRSHLEALFEPAMSWTNYGTAWHIDHRRPVSTFDLPRQVRECWALSNLQPLGNVENIRKGARWNGFDPRTKPRKQKQLSTPLIPQGHRPA